MLSTHLSTTPPVIHNSRTPAPTTVQNGLDSNWGAPLLEWHGFGDVAGLAVLFGWSARCGLLHHPDTGRCRRTGQARYLAMPRGSGQSLKKPRGKRQEQRPGWQPTPVRPAAHVCSRSGSSAGARVRAPFTRRLTSRRASTTTHQNPLESAVAKVAVGAQRTLRRLRRLRVTSPRRATCVRRVRSW